MLKSWKIWTHIRALISFTTHTHFSLLTFLLFFFSDEAKLLSPSSLTLGEEGLVLAGQMLDCMLEECCKFIQMDSSLGFVQSIGICSGPIGRGWDNLPNGS